MTSNRGGSYHEYKDQQNVISRTRSKEGREIGPLPQVADPARRERGRTSLRAFFDAYLSEHYFYRPYTETLEQIIATAQRVSFDGGKFALSAKRRGSKTTILQCTQLHALLYGIHPYQFFLAATEKKAEEAQEFFMNELENNELIRADFPEICYPIEKREGKQQRSLKYHGRPLKIKISSDMIRLGLIEREEVVDDEARLVPYPSGPRSLWPTTFRMTARQKVRFKLKVLRRCFIRPFRRSVDTTGKQAGFKSRRYLWSARAFIRTISSAAWLTAKKTHHTKVWFSSEWFLCQTAWTCGESIVIFVRNHIAFMATIATERRFMLNTVQKWIPERSRMTKTITRKIKFPQRNMRWINGAKTSRAFGASIKTSLT